jgi:hypothetical protein
MTNALLRVTLKHPLPAPILPEQLQVAIRDMIMTVTGYTATAEERRTCGT